jgi:hypothetical protein
MKRFYRGLSLSLCMALILCSAGCKFFGVDQGEQTAATPAFSLAAGSYDSDQTVAISTSTPDATIYYTIDGSTPTGSSLKYLGPVPVSGAGKTIKAFARKSGMKDSAVAAATYSIQAKYLAVGSVSDAYDFDYPAYWIDGELACLPLPAGAQEGYAYSGQRSGDDLYILGNAADAAEKYSPGYWKNGAWNALPVIDNTKYAFARRSLIVDGDIYIAGYSTNASDKRVPCYWKNGIRTDLPVLDAGQSSFARGIAVSGGKILVAGYSRQATINIPGYWEDGVWKALSTNPALDGTKSACADAIAVIGGDTYITGYGTDTAGTQVCGYWLNGSWVGVAGSGSAMPYRVHDLAVDGADVLATGYAITTVGEISTYYPCFWKNGSCTLLTGEGQAEGYAFDLTMTANGPLISGSIIDAQGVEIPGTWLDGTWSATTLGAPMTGGVIYGHERVTTASLAAQEKSGALTGIAQPTLYFAGVSAASGTSMGCYWKGMKRVDLDGSLTAMDIALDGGDVIVAGVTSDFKPVYWVGATMFSLPTLGSSGTGNAASIAIANGKRYIAGYTANEAGVSVPCYWVDGVRSDVSVLDATCDSWVQTLRVVGNDVYLAGYSRMTGDIIKLSYWVNGARTDLDALEPEILQYSNIMAIDGGDVYVVGTCLDGSKKIACYWKNGLRQDLAPIDIAQDACGYSIAIQDGAVYVVGFSRSADATTTLVWKNGACSILPSPPGGKGYPLDIHLGPTDTWAVGFTENQYAQYRPLFWRGGMLQALEGEGAILSCFSE